MMDSGGFSSRRAAEAFPAGLRVLVVDDDPTWLKILEKMLKKCSYEVTTCNLAREALSLLRERKDGFDIVISDVNMPDMDGFKLLEHVGLEMDLPVIMMSVDGETSRVMKGVQHGACDYLLKPIRMKELRNIWQHVFRKRIHEGIEDSQFMKSLGEQSEDGYCDLGKRKRDDERVCSDACSSSTNMMKKARVVWTVDLHQKFVQAVNHIGLEKVGPKKILDLMGVPWLTREHVASHLQKYRLFLSRLERENELKAAFTGTKASEASKVWTEDPCLQTSGSMAKLVKESNILIHNMPKPGASVFSFTDLKAKPFMKLQPFQLNQESHPHFCSDNRTNSLKHHHSILGGSKEVERICTSESDSSGNVLGQTDLGSAQRSLIHGYGSAFEAWNQDFSDVVSTDFYPFCAGIESMAHGNQAGAPELSHDLWKFETEYQSDVTEYQVIGKDLYII